MSRSLKKGPYVDEKFMKKVVKTRAAGQTVIPKTWSRSSTIVPDMIGLTIGVHNGKAFIEVLITEEMIGHKLGEFSPTTFFKAHGGKKEAK
jgi:small subunit ribosomal protein S19